MFKRLFIIVIAISLLSVMNSAYSMNFDNEQFGSSPTAQIMKKHSKKCCNKYVVPCLKASKDITSKACKKGCVECICPLLKVSMHSLETCCSKLPSRPSWCRYSNQEEFSRLFTGAVCSLAIAGCVSRGLLFIMDSYEHQN